VCGGDTTQFVKEWPSLPILDGSCRQSSERGSAVVPDRT
jgi:hypothetical protein